MWRTIFYKWCLGSWFLVILWLMLIGLIISIPVIIVWDIRKKNRVRRFFERYEPSEGIVYDYVFDEAASYMTTLPMSNGNSTVLQPHYRDLPESYYIRIECRNNGLHFLLVYEIPSVEYEKKKAGSKVKIKRSWIPYGYLILDD